MKEDYIIAILEFAHANVNRTVTTQEIIAMLNDKGFDIGNQDLMMQVERLIANTFIRNTASEKLQLNPESYFNYLDHLEMKQAMESSKQANRWAVIALVVTAIIGLIQIIIAVNQSAAVGC